MFLAEKLKFLTVFPGFSVERSMDKVRELMEKILAEKPEISAEAIMARLEQERRKTGGYISDDILLQAIAAELGVKISKQNIRIPRMKIKDLIPGLSNVTITGRVIATYPSKAQSKWGSKKLSFFIADRTGIIKVILRNNRVNLNIKTGQIVRVRCGYVREDRWGKLELHVGERGSIEVDPEDIEAKEYPTVVEFSTSIGEITKAHRDKRIHLRGRIRDIYQPSTFEKRSGGKGKVLRFILEDETGRIQTVVWNEKVDELEAILASGATIQLVNAKVKSALNGSFEIHVDSKTYVEVLEPQKQITKIAQLAEGMEGITIEGKVTVAPTLREVKTSKGEIVKLTTFEIEDETGRVTVSAWRENAEKAALLKAGDTVVIKNAYVKKGLKNNLEISTKNSSTICIRQ